MIDWLRSSYRCNESVTYTTHGDVTFLDNLVPLAKRWDGPLSMAVYTPGSDYDAAMHSIAYLRQCTESDIRRKVTFHLVLDERHFPPSLRKLHSAQGLTSAASADRDRPASSPDVVPVPVPAAGTPNGPTSATPAGPADQRRPLLVSLTLN